MLFDFADLDCWYNGEQYTVAGIPMENPRYNGDEAAHTTFESCENKARAFWWLLARIAGWEGTNVSPLPDVKANGQDGPIVVSQSTPISIEISLDPGDKTGQNADWWLVELTPSEAINYFDLYTGSMVPGLLPTYQGPLFGFGSVPLFNSPNLTVGTHIFCFGVDINMDGSLNADSLYYDCVSVNVTEQ